MESVIKPLITSSKKTNALALTTKEFNTILTHQLKSKLSVQEFKAVLEKYTNTTLKTIISALIPKLDSNDFKQSMEAIMKQMHEYFNLVIRRQSMGKSMGKSVKSIPSLKKQLFKKKTVKSIRSLSNQANTTSSSGLSSSISPFASSPSSLSSPSSHPPFPSPSSPSPSSPPPLNAVNLNNNPVPRLNPVHPVHVDFASNSTMHSTQSCGKGKSRCSNGFRCIRKKCIKK
jgi:hypothetical protein